jgi:phenylacetic acid degradation protein
MIYSFKGMVPVIHESAFIHPQATVTGNVVIGKHVYIGPSAALRGDFGKIIIGDGSNVQENCTIHMFPGVTVVLGENCHIGHGAIVHGASLGNNILVGMNSVIMDEVTIGDDCIIGALCFIKANEKIPARSMVVGNPGKIIKEVTDEMIAWKSKGTEIYQNLAQECQSSLVECLPLREAPADSADLQKSYDMWHSVKTI